MGARPAGRRPGALAARGARLTTSGELFVRLAETEGGANAAAAAAASEWERASASMSDDEAEISRIGASKGLKPDSAESAEKAVAHHREDRPSSSDCFSSGA